MDTKITDLRAKLTELKALTKIDLLSIPAANRPGWETKQRNALSQIESVEDALAQEILNKSVTIIIENNVAATQDVISFLQSAEGEDVVVPVDFMKLEKDLATSLFSNVRGGIYPFNGETSNRINILLSELTDKFGILEMPIVKIPASMYGTLNNANDALNRVSTIMQATYGNDLKGLVLRKTLMDEARKRLASDRLAIVMYNVPQESVNFANILRIKSAVISGNENASDAVIAGADSTGESLVKEAIKKMSGKKKKNVADESA